MHNVEAPFDDCMPLAIYVSKAFELAVMHWVF